VPQTGLGSSRGSGRSVLVSNLPLMWYDSFRIDLHLVFRTPLLGVEIPKWQRSKKEAKSIDRLLTLLGIQNERNRMLTGKNTGAIEKQCARLSPRGRRIRPEDNLRTSTACSSSPAGRSP
jgi:hypothetical protein